MTQIRTPLSKLATYVNGRAFKSSDWSTQGLPIIRIQNLNNPDAEFNYYNGEYDNRNFVESGDLLISWSASLGVYIWEGEDALLNQHIFKIVFDKDIDIDKKYFYYAVSKLLGVMESNMHGATMKHITKKKFNALEIPLPPLKVQQQIVEILDEADALRKKREKTIEKLSTLQESIFYEMFGDPLRNKHKWPVRKLVDICTDKGSYGSGASSSAYSSNKPRYIRITDIKDNGELTEEKVSPSTGPEDWEKYKLEQGDLVFARSGATVGKTYLYKPKDGSCVYAGYLIKFHAKKNVVLPEFLFSFTQTKFYDLWVASKQKVVAQPNINAKQYGNELMVIVPPISLQHEYVSKINNINSHLKLLDDQKNKFNKLFNSSLQKAFSGELKIN